MASHKSHELAQTRGSHDQDVRIRLERFDPDRFECKQVKSDAVLECLLGGVFEQQADTPQSCLCVPRRLIRALAVSW